MKKILMIIPLTFCLFMSCQDRQTVADLEKFKAKAQLEEQNKALVMKYVDYMSSKDTAYVSLLAPDYRYYFPSASPKPMDAAGDLANAKNIWLTFPDIRWDSSDITASGDKVILRYHATATQQGEFMGIPPSGKKIEFTGIMVLKIENGKVAEQREEADMLGLMQQLGMELKPSAKK